MGTSRTYKATLVEMSPATRRRLIRGYERDRNWVAIFKKLRSQADVESETTEDEKPNRRRLAYCLIDGLIYRTSQNSDITRLCLPGNFELEVFKSVHDDCGHATFHRSYQRVIETVHFNRLSRRLRMYIRFCPSCYQDETREEIPENIPSQNDAPMMPFHTISLSFVVRLPVQDHGHEQLLVMTDKTSGQVCLVSGRSSWTASAWASDVFDSWVRNDWNIPHAILCENNVDFLSDFWKVIFERAGRKLLLATAYHPQNNLHGGTTTPVIEFALRYCATEYTVSWIDILPGLQLELNNSPHCVTGISPNDYLQHCSVREASSATTDPSEANDYIIVEATTPEQEVCINSALAFARSKIGLIARSTSFEMGAEVWVRLYHRVRHMEAKSAPVGQTLGPFQLVQKVGAWAYELNIPSNLELHPVMSIAQLIHSPTPEVWHSQSLPMTPIPTVRRSEGTKFKVRTIDKILDRRFYRDSLQLVKQYLVHFERLQF